MDVLLEEDEALLVVVSVVLVGVLVIEVKVVELLGLAVEVEDEVCVEVDSRDVLLVDVLDPSDDDVDDAVRVDTLDCEVLLVALCEGGWRYTSAANAPAIKTSVIPDIRAMVENLPATPADFLGGILSLTGSRERPSYARA